MITLEEIFQAVRTRGFTPSLEPPAGDPQPAPRSAEAQALDVEVIAHGEEVQLERHLVAGKLTVVDYYADWCGPCQLLGHALERLLAGRSDVALRKLDIVSWTSAAAAQAKRDFHLQGIPYVRVYGPDGDFRGEVSGNRVEDVARLLEGPDSAAAAGAR